MRIDCRAELGSEEACDGLSYRLDSIADREDGVARTLARDGGTIVVGEIGPDEQQTVSLTFPGRPEGSFRLHFSAAAWNGNGASTSVGVVVGDPESDPPAATGRSSNDDFANAMILEETEGEVAFDLLTATADPGDHENTMYVIERDGDTGTLRIVHIMPGGGDSGIEGLARVQAMAVSSSHLFVSAGTGGADTLVFDLADPGDPVSLGVQNSFLPTRSLARCRPVPRTDVVAVDVFCGGRQRNFTVQVAGDGTLLAADLIYTSGFTPDYFGTVMPDNDDTVSAAGSPDGRHFYTAGVDRLYFYVPNVGFEFTTTDQMLVFERVYEPVAESADTED